MFPAASVTAGGWGLVLFFILASFCVPPSQAQYENTRCKCICPDPHVVIYDVSDVNYTSSNLNRTLYINNLVLANKCNCMNVVIPLVVHKVPNITGKEGEFCPRCDCVFESRNSGIIKVVVIIVIWVVSLLVIYMLFLMCLDPLLNKRIKSTAYQEHMNEDDESVGGGRLSSSHAMRVTNSSSSMGAATTSTSLATTLGPSSSSVLNRVGNVNRKWTKQLAEQKKNVYDRHNMLN